MTSSVDAIRLARPPQKRRATVALIHPSWWTPPKDGLVPIYRQRAARSADLLRHFRFQRLAASRV